MSPSEFGIRKAYGKSAEPSLIAYACGNGTNGGRTVESTASKRTATEGRDPVTGKFQPGNRAAKGRGTAERLGKAAEKRAARQAAAEVRAEALRQAGETISGAMPSVVTDLRKRALEGDNTAAGLLLRHGLPLSSNETTIRNAEDLAHLAPESRIRAINARVASGELPLEHGQQLVVMAQSELHSEVVMPLRKLMMDLKSGEDPATALRRLLSLADTFDVLESDSAHTVCTKPGEAAISSSPSGITSDD